MASPSLAVHRWPLPAPSVRAASQAQQGLLVIGVATPMSSNRDFGRARIRQALRAALAILLDLPPEAIELRSVPGQPLRIARPALPGQRIGLSVSHQPGLVLGAICLQGAVGIDLMQVEDHAEQDWQAVARDYLGPHACARIARHPPALRPQAFAQEWTRLEAGLKCHGQALTEWQPALERSMQRCRLSGLALPAGLVGSVATCP